MKTKAISNYAMIAILVFLATMLVSLMAAAPAKAELIQAKFDVTKTSINVGEVQRILPALVNAMQDASTPSVEEPGGEPTFPDAGGDEMVPNDEPSDEPEDEPGDQPGGDQPNDEPSDEPGEDEPTTTSTTKPNTTTTVSSGRLPFTGGNSTPWLIIGAVIAGAGIGLLIRKRPDTDD